MTTQKKIDPFNRRIHLALVHYPVYNKEGDIIASALTTIDIHDFSRVARTYQLGGVWVVTPLESQKNLLDRMVRHWTEGYGAIYNPNRKEALQHLNLANSIDEMTEKIRRVTGSPVRHVATSAKVFENSLSITALSEIIQTSSEVFVLLFGTGWGLSETIIKGSEWVLTPIRPYGYNHLSVRSAASILCDRLIGEE
jgi:hypothetical protein